MGLQCTVRSTNVWECEPKPGQGGGEAARAQDVQLSSLDCSDIVFVKEGEGDYYIASKPKANITINLTVSGKRWSSFTSLPGPALPANNG